MFSEKIFILKGGFCMPKMSGAQAVVEAFMKENVEYVFGLPGGACLPLYDALYDAKFRVILVRHEQGAVHMAEGYARSTGKAGVFTKPPV